MKKFMILALFVAALAFFLTGCSTESGTTTENNSANELSNTTVTGRVTVVEGNSITIQLGELQQSEINQDHLKKADTTSGEQSSNEQNSSEQAPKDNATTGNLPDGNPPDGDAPTGQTPPDQQDPGQAPSGNMPSGGPMTFTAGDSSVTFTVDEDFALILEDQTTTGTIADIAVDDILEVTFGDNNTVSAITVKSLNEGPGGPGGPKGSNPPDQTNNSNSSEQTPDADTNNTGE